MNVLKDKVFDEGFAVRTFGPDLFTHNFVLLLRHIKRFVIWLRMMSLPMRALYPHYRGYIREFGSMAKAQHSISSSNGPLSSTAHGGGCHQTLRRREVHSPPVRRHIVCRPYPNNATAAPELRSSSGLIRLRGD